MAITDKPLAYDQAGAPRNDNALTYVAITEMPIAHHGVVQRPRKKSSAESIFLPRT
jgi:hypothetical protein